MNYYLGIDIGTSSTKGVCYNDRGIEQSQLSISYPLFQPHPGYAEQNPSDWVNAVAKIIKQMLLNYDIKGIGLSGQMHGLVLLDKNDNILRPSIIWCDNRSYKEKLEIEDIIGKDRIKEITGNEAMAPFTLAKLLWVKNNEPDIYAKIDKVLLPKDYVKYVLTGAFKTEFSDASGMQMIDISSKCYSKELLAKLEIDEHILPQLCESVEIAGYLKEEIFPGHSNVFLVGGAGDQAAGALGNGIISSNQVSVVLGSSGVVFKPIEKDDIKKANVQVFMHAIKDTYHIMGVTNGCGLSYQWYNNNLSRFKESKDLYNINESLMAQTKPLANGLIYLPYLNGERTPHNDSIVRGSILGITQATTNEEILRAVIEGICYSIKDTFDATDIDSDKDVFVSGGGANSETWCKILSTMLHTSLFKNESKEAGTLGVAILAMVADGAYKTIEEAVKHVVSIGQIVTPIEKNYKIYDNYFKLYQEGYKALKDYYELQARLED